MGLFSFFFSGESRTEKPLTFEQEMWEAKEKYEQDKVLAEKKRLEDLSNEVLEKVKASIMTAISDGHDRIHYFAPTNDSIKGSDNRRFRNDELQILNKLCSEKGFTIKDCSLQGARIIHFKVVKPKEPESIPGALTLVSDERRGRVSLVR